MSPLQVGFASVCEEVDGPHLFLCQVLTLGTKAVEALHTEADGGLARIRMASRVGWHRGVGVGGLLRMKRQKPSTRVNNYISIMYHMCISYDMCNLPFYLTHHLLES